MIGGHTAIIAQHRNYTSFKKYAAYVMQDDDMFAELSVREHITFSAMLRLPADMPDRYASCTRIVFSAMRMRAWSCLELVPW